MKLYQTPTSPFVRKVLVTAHELGLADRIENVLLRPVPTKPDAELSRANPLSKIPALVLDDGSALYDSRVICEYLDALGGAPRLVPASGPERWRVLRVQALCDGVLDAGVLVFYERSGRPEDKHWAPWLEGQTAKAQQGLDALEREVDRFGESVDLAQISAGCAIGWLELRGAVGEVRAGRPKLSSWYDAFRTRASMKATEPPGS